MSFEPIDEKLSRTSFLRGPEPHVVLDEKVCARCPIGRVCLRVCPAANFKFDERSGQTAVSWESCLECGACRLACTAGAVRWTLPRGGAGVCYRQG